MFGKEKITVVCALLPNFSKAEEALQAMANKGIDKSNISVITNQKEFEEKEFEEHVGTKWHHESVESGKRLGVAGAAIYGLTAIAGMTIAGASLLAAGPIVVALTAAGGVLGGLLGFGYTEDEVSGIDKALREGKTLLGIHLSEGTPANDIENILKTIGAERIHQHHVSAPNPST